jgi:uncharacterized phage protein gp47/JayE
MGRPKSMYEEITVEGIKTDILGRLSADIDKREGSFVNDMVSTVAYEIWKVYQSFNALVPIAFVDETSGEYIDKRCNEYGITRKPGTKATATLSITGTDGTAITKGKIFITIDGLQYEADEAATIASGTATVNVTAVEVGEAYNAAAASITGQLINLAGITSVTNVAAAEGGTDREIDSALLARLRDFLQSTPTSGNAAHYKQWALSVPGVGSAKVIPLWDGTGTVKVIIAGADGGAVDASVITACEEFIDANKPIGATVTVVSAVEVEVDVTADVVFDDTTGTATIQDEFEVLLTEHLRGISFVKNEIVYNRIAALLLSVSGVTDFVTLTVNAGMANISLDADEVPVLGTVVIT